MFYILCIIGGVLGTMRWFGVTNPTYQATAHIFVGSMFAAAFVLWKEISFKSGVKYGLLAIALTLLEVYVFLASLKII